MKYMIFDDSFYDIEKNFDIEFEITKTLSEEEK